MKLSVSAVTYYNAICTLQVHCPPAKHYLAFIGTRPDTIVQEKYVRAHSEELERAILLPGQKKTTVKVEMIPAIAVLKQVDLLIEQKRSWLDELQKKKFRLVDARAKKN